ncbi:MAG: sulfide-dependent adenosine diphosphate thiazole synthase [Candidatus Thermoplasmatota archaeon]|nr:sulfide-dependent adenosine diphosphate thiazole synthase [Candidatus Thermoplasmatota archaeon]
MKVRDTEITKCIFEEFSRKFIDSISMDVAVVGAGPSGLTAARYLANAGKKVCVFERKLSPGGGMWGGGMSFPVIVVPEGGKEILEEVGVKCKKRGDYFIADSIEAASKVIAGAIDAGVTIFNSVTVEDVMAKEGRICGIVVNWTGTLKAGMHVDPLSLEAKAVIDGTGHPSEICRIVEKKIGLNTVSGKVEGEKFMWADEGERKTVENTGEVYPGLYTTGMASNAVMGAPRMGPIFGGMLLSGKKVAEMILEKI